MRRLIVCIALCGVLACSKETPEKVAAPALLPMPASMNVGDGAFALSSETIVVAKGEEEKAVADFLTSFLKQQHHDFPVSAEDAPHAITLTIDNSLTTPPEGYHLAVTNDGIVVKASSGQGLFYGVQTLIQLIGVDHDGIAAVTIADEPRFGYRGMHLDVGRHMFPPEFIKKYIDMMAHFKYNTFHWHLTEDQGWRIEIKKYPRLQEVASQRAETVVGHASTRTRDQSTYDGKPYGGYYTQAEVKDIVAYAAKRYITVVPEIEMPGHAQAALAAYPELGCTGGPYEVATTWGVFEDIYCAGKESTFEFLEDVLDEVVELFPGKYVHIGGDESPKARWEKCPNCQKRIKAEGLKDEHALQSYFIQRMEKYLNTKGKSIIGWDEILEGGLAPNATVMSWRGEEGGIAAARQHHDVIMTPVKWCYLDYYQADPETEPLAIGGFLPVSQVYGYEPQPDSLTDDEKKYIKGAQVNLWTEYIPDGDYVEYMVYPRAIAMSEVVWSPKASRDYAGFVDRVSKQRPLLDAWHINYAKHIFAADSVAGGK